MMVTIAGNGMGDYTLQNISLDLKSFDAIVCDTNFKDDAPNIIKLSYKDAKEYILSNYKEQNILYVVTGSVFFYSAGIIIAKMLPPKYVQIMDNTSSKAYMQQKLLLSDSEISTLSLHGRERIDLKELFAKKHTFVLCDNKTIDRLQQATRYLSQNAYSVTIGYKLGYSDEQIKTIELSQIATQFDLTQPYVLILTREFEPTSPICKDSEFATQRGMITKEYKRHFALQNLDLLPNMTLWDVGSGSGSCAIEAYKRYRVKTVLFENKPQRIEYIKKNLASHYVCDALLLEGDAQDMFEQVTSNPDRIFVGGGGKEVIAKLGYLYSRLNDNGVILLNAITLKNLSHIITVLNQEGISYEVISFTITTYKGSLDLIEPQRQLFQIKITKECK